MKIDKSIVFTYILGYLTVGLLFGAFRQFTGIPAFWPSIALLVIYTLVFNPAVFAKRSLILVYILWYVLFIFDHAGYFVGFPEVHLQFFGVFSLVFPYILSLIILENLFCLKEKAFSVIEKIAKLALVFFAINSLLTIVSEYFFSGATRVIGGNINLPGWVVTHTFGAIYGIPFILGALVANYKGKNVLIWLSGLVILFSILVAGFTIAFSITIFVLIGALLIRFQVKSMRYIAPVLFLLMILGLRNTEFAINILQDLPNPVYAEKTQDIRKLGAEGYFYTIRGGVYEVSIKSFLENPLIGSGTWKNVGEHSYILDRLGFIGIFGTVLFMAVVFILYNRAELLVPKEGKLLFKFLFLTLLGLLIFNPFYQFDFWVIMFVYLPIIIGWFCRRIKPTIQN